MDAVREVCSAASSVRKAEGLRVRLPLATLTVGRRPTPRRCAPSVDLIAEEVNVKQVVLTAESTVASRVLKLVPAVLGPRVGRRHAEAAAGRQGRADDVVGARPTAASRSLGRVLAADEYALVPQGGGAAHRVLAGTDVVVTLDSRSRPELEAEGLARDLVRAVNDARRAEGLHVSDRIQLVIDVNGHADVAAAVEAHRALIMAEVLADELVVAGDGERHHHPADAHRVELTDGRAIHLSIARADA